MTKGGKAKNRARSGGKSKDDLERKRDERARRNALKKEREAKEYLENDENFVSFSNQLQVLGYRIRDIKGDGNCLFRALADQLDGNDEGHLIHRRIIVKYIADHREEFEPFVEDNKSFDEHVKELSKPGTYGGNDSIVAFSRYHGVNVIIHQLNERCWVIQGEKFGKSGEPLRELHISYHNGDHYSSVRRIGDPGDGPAWLFSQKHKGNVCYHDKKVVKKDNDSDVELLTNGSDDVSKTKKCTNVEGTDMQTLQESGDVAIIQAATGCQDELLIRQTLLESNYDLDAAISFILQLQSFATAEEDHAVMAEQDQVDTLTYLLKDENVSSKSQENMDETVGVLTIPMHPNKQSKAQGGARPKIKQQALSNRKRKAQAKQEKKARRMEERKQQTENNEKQEQQQEEVDQNIPVVSDLQALAI